MDKYDTSQRTEFPRFEEPESTQSGVTGFFNKIWKFPMFSGNETTENQSNTEEDSSKVSNATGEVIQQQVSEEKPESASLAVEYEGRSLPNVLRRISSLIALGSSSGTKYADTELARYWMPDDVSRECYECAARFSAIRRRHHCRVCGQIFCASCCNQRVPGQIFGCAGGLRVCNYCCSVVLSYLNSHEMTGDITPDLRSLQESLQSKFPEAKPSQSSRSANFMFDENQDERLEASIPQKEILEEIFKKLVLTLPLQQHRYRLVRHTGVWRGGDMVQCIIDNTSFKTSSQAAALCYSLVSLGYVECVTESSGFADYSLYRPCVVPQCGRESPEERRNLTGSISSYCLDLNLDENSARLTRATKQETKASPPAEEETPIVEQVESDPEPDLSPTIARIGDEHLNLIVRQCCARQALPAVWVDILTELCQQAANSITPDLLSNDIDPRNYVQIKKVPGGAATDSCVVNGVVLTKNVAHRAMPQEIDNPTILLLNCSISYQRVEGKLASLEPVLMQEQEYVVRCAARISALGPSLVLCAGGVARGVHDALLAARVALAAGLRPRALRRLARCLAADAAPHLHARVAPPRLGTCRRYYLQHYPGKTLMILENCARPHLGCCILLRGASLQELARVKKVARFALLAYYNWRHEKTFLADMEADLPKTGMEFDDEEKCGENEIETDEGLKHKFVRKTESDKTLSCGVPIKDFSDPLHASVDDDVFLAQEEAVLKADDTHERWSTDDIVLSMSPNVKIPAPYFESDSGRKCKWRRFFQLIPYKPAPPTPKVKRKSSTQCSNNVEVKEEHPFISTPISAPADNAKLRASLAHFRATGCPVIGDGHLRGCPKYKLGLVKKKTKDLELEAEKYATDPLDPLAIENHQKLSVLLFSYSEKSPNVPDFCVNPWTVTMEMYGAHDISLGAFLEKYCFNSEYKCPSNNCHIPMNQHTRKFVHGDVCITIKCNTVGTSNPEKSKEPQNKQVWVWSRCAACGAAGARRRLRAARWSLGALLAWRARCPRYTRRCPHALHAHTHALSTAHTTAYFTYSKIKTYNIELPPDVIWTKYDTRQMRTALLAQCNDLLLKAHETYASIPDVDTDKDYTQFKQHMEQIHLALTSTSLQEHTSLAGIVRSLWQASDKIIIGEKMLRDVQEKYSSPPAKNIKNVPDSSVEDKSDLEDSSGDGNDSSGTTYHFADNVSGKEEKEHEKGVEEDEEKGDKKTVKQILSQLLPSNQPSNQSGIIISSGVVPVVVMAAEIGSVIAATLSSLHYLRTLESHLDGQQEADPKEGKDKTDGDKAKSKSNEHIEVLLKEDLVCRVYYASQFHKLRHMLLAPLSTNAHITDEFLNKDAAAGCEEADCGCGGASDHKSLCEIEECFIRSLAYCVPWAARGGKSGSTFCKTTDDRYVLKEMTKPEWQQFLEFAPHYFSYVITCRQNHSPSVLARIVGVYSVGGAGVLVLENVWYGAAEHAARFDLKGSSRHRRADLAPRAVLMDENLLHMRWENQLYIPSHTHRVLFNCLERDTKFLSQNSVMDYSLLLAIEDDTLVLGIVDYIRTFTWDKKLEHLVKKNLGSGQPTVVSPEQYRERFLRAAHRYFPPAPAHWQQHYTLLLPPP